MGPWNISRSVKHWARVKPEATAIVFDDAAITWREFDHQVDAMVETLRSRGVAPGDRVACVLNNRPEYYYAFFGSARLGSVFVPVNTSFTASEMQYLIDDADAALAITEAALSETVLQCLDAARVLDIDAMASAPPRDGLDDAGPQRGGDDLLAILYTSGTTGRPKGATFSHVNFYFTAQTLITSFGYRAEDVHLVNSPLHFTGGLLTLSQAPILTGATLVLNTFVGAAHAIDQIERHRVSIYLSVPAILTMIVHDEAFRPEALASLRVVSAGSAALPLPLITAYREMGVELGQAYALTEGGGMSSILLPEDVTTRIGSAGRSTLFSEVRVVDAAGHTAVPGAVGEIQQRGPSVTGGYWRNETANAQLFAPDGWIRTGDLGTMDADGYLTVVGRSKDLIIAGGVNIYPAEIESVLTGHPAFAEVAVIGLPHEVYGETVTAVVSLRPGMEPPTIDEVRAFCAGELATYKQPRVLKVMPSLPRTASGKIRKVDLPEMLS